MVHLNPVLMASFESCFAHEVIWVGLFSVSVASFSTLLGDTICMCVCVCVCSKSLCFLCRLCVCVCLCVCNWMIDFSVYNWIVLFTV